MPCAALAPPHDWLLRHAHTLPTTIGQPRRAPRWKRGCAKRPGSGPAFEQVLAEFATASPVHHPPITRAFRLHPSARRSSRCWATADRRHQYFAGVWLEAAGPTMVEVLVLDWFKQFLGYPRRRAAC